MRSGPSDGHRIVHRGLPSGTELEVLGVDTAAEYTHVRTAGGARGLDQHRNISSKRTRSAQVQLATANNRIQALERQLAQRGEALTGTEEHQQRSGVERRSAGGPSGESSKPNWPK